MKKKQIMALAAFLVLMLVFTILSRAADTMSIPRVTTAIPEKRVIGHEISAQGKVIQNREQAVSTEAQQIVKSIHVNDGQQVEEGDLLFELDMQKLEEQIVLTKEQLEVLKLKREDTVTGKQAGAQNRAKSQNQANQDYNDAVNDGSDAINKAKEAWDLAEEQVRNFKPGDVKPGGEDEVEKTLKATAKEKKKAYDKAVRDREDLEQEIEDKIAEANQAASTEAESGAAPIPTEAEIRASYKSQLDTAEATEKKIEKEMETADTALEQYRSSREAQQGEDAESTRAQLIQAAEQAKAAYEDAVKQYEQGVRTAQKGINDANSAEGTNNNDKMEEIEIDQKERELLKLERLQKDNGKILAPVKGIITKINITVGDRTPDGTAMLMADLTSGSKFVAQITKDQEKKVFRNDEATLKESSGEKKEIAGLKIESIKPNEENPELYDVTIQLTENQLEIGTGADMTIHKKSQQYSTCVPLSALYKDNNQYYVLVMDKVESVLGEESTARRVDVTVVEKNDQYAALADGAVAPDQEVITGADRSLEAGSRVRLQEQ